MLIIEELEKLREENERLKEELDTYKKIWNDKEVHIALTDVRTGERKLWYENCLKYKTCLQEIKEILLDAMDIKSNAYNHFSKVEKAIQLIDKAEEE